MAGGKPNSLGWHFFPLFSSFAVFSTPTCVFVTVAKAHLFSLKSELFTILMFSHTTHDFNHPMCLTTFELINHLPECSFITADEFLLPIQFGRHKHPQQFSHQA